MPVAILAEKEVKDLLVPILAADEQVPIMAEEVKRGDIVEDLPVPIMVEEVKDSLGCWTGLSIQDTTSESMLQDTTARTSVTRTASAISHWISQWLMVSMTTTTKLELGDIPGAAVPR